MFEFSHYIDRKFPQKSNSPPPEDDAVVVPLSAKITYGNILFNDYKTEALATQIVDVKLKAEGLQKERDFYYNKLRDIESFCRVLEESNDPAVSRILSIIYETQEIRKVKTKKRRGGKKKKNRDPEEDIEDYPPCDFPPTLGGGSSKATI